MEQCHGCVEQTDAGNWEMVPIFTFNVSVEIPFWDLPSQSSSVFTI